MVIIGTGIDLVVINRIAKVWQRHASLFEQRILHPEELIAFSQVNAQMKVRWLAKRWAVKEAAAKALGTGFRQGVTFTQFIYEHDSLGKPMLRLTDTAESLAQIKSICEWHVSLSDERDYVVAMVIAERS